jgi:hypothetical protein
LLGQGIEGELVELAFFRANLAEAVQYRRLDRNLFA